VIGAGDGSPRKNPRNTRREGDRPEYQPDFRPSGTVINRGTEEGAGEQREGHTPAQSIQEVPEHRAVALERILAELRWTGPCGSQSTRTAWANTKVSDAAKKAVARTPVTW